MRLCIGSLRKKGVTSYKEFYIPKGIVEQPYMKRLALVYHNLANWLHTYYPLSGYTYLTPVLGLLAYDATNLSATNLFELDMTATGDFISITFLDMPSSPDGSVPKSVFFDLSGSPSFSIVVNNNVCSTTQQGHFSIIVESIAPAPVLFSLALPLSRWSSTGTKTSRKEEESHENRVDYCWVYCWWSALVVAPCIPNLVAVQAKKEKQNEVDGAGRRGWRVTSHGISRGNKSSGYNKHPHTTNPRE